MTVRFRVTGRVQGVGFRAHVFRLAVSLGATGEVWNTRDGAVEGWADLPLDRVATFRSGLAKGPGHPDDIDVEETADRAADSFRIVETR